MKAFSLLLSTLATATLLQPRAVGAEFIVRVEVPQADQLTQQDVEAIVQVKENLVRRRERNLRQRQRQLDPYWCHAQCKHTIFPYCQIWNPQCYDHRRTLHETASTATNSATSRDGAENDIVDTPLYKVRELVGGDCEAEKQLILQKLEAAVSDASNHVVVSSTMSCFELLDTCSVDSFNLLDSKTDVVAAVDIGDGYKICNNFEFSIEAVAETCVGNVKFELTGSKDYSYTHTEYTSMYSMFKNVGADIEGRKLPVGSYNLKVTADSNEELVNYLSFDVVQC
jgi:hypothetical protein